MGQRLNIEIVDGETVLANCYYQRSGYTESALGLTQRIIDAYPKIKGNSVLETAVKLLEMTCGGVNDEERARIEKDSARFGHIQFRDDIDREHGLLAVTEAGIEETRYWEQGRVTIDLRSETVAFGAFWCWEPDEYRKDFLEENDDWCFESLPECDIDFSRIPFDQFDEVASFIKNHEEGVQYNGEFICWIA